MCTGLHGDEVHRWSISGSHVLDALIQISLGSIVFGMFIAHVLYIWSESTIAKRDRKIQLTFEGHQNE